MYQKPIIVDYTILVWRNIKFISRNNLWEKKSLNCFKVISFRLQPVFKAYFYDN